MDVYNCMCVRACACVCVCVCVCVCEKSQTLVKKWYVSSSFISWLSFIHCDTNIFRVNQFWTVQTMIFWNLASLNESFRVLFGYLNDENRFARCTWVRVVLIAVIMHNYARMHVCVFVCIFVHSCECVCVCARARMFVSVPVYACAQGNA